jgi:SAM-dependent methyltransferase
MNDKHRPEAEFDDHALGYVRDMENTVPGMLAEGDYFSRYKVEMVAARTRAEPPRAILDFGCGIGLALQQLVEYFPKAEVWGYDPSQVSLDHARTRAPTARYASAIDDLPKSHFDVVFIANVFHHIPKDARLAAMRACGELLSGYGRIFIFEHNPYNPATRWVFERCPFDEGAEMLKRRATIALAESAGLHVASKRYTLFFPKPLAIFRKLEPAISWLPLGAQYCVELAK